MTLKHDSSISVGILVEQLVHATTRAVLEGKRRLASELGGVYRRFMAPGTLLAREAEAFQTVMRSRGLRRPVAERVLAEALDAVAGLDRDRLQGQRMALKAQLFNLIDESEAMPVRDVEAWGCLQVLADARRGGRQLSEAVERATAFEALIERMCSVEPPKGRLVEPECDSLSYSLALESFEERYGGLSDVESQLLSEHVTCLSGGFTHYPVLNRQQSRVADSLGLYLRDGREPKEDRELEKRLREVVALLGDPRSCKTVDERIELTMMALALEAEVEGSNRG